MQLSAFSTILLNHSLHSHQVQLLPQQESPDFGRINEILLKRNANHAFLS